MHNLCDIKNASFKARDKDDAATQALFRTVADPCTVLELADVVVVLLSYIEGVDDFSAKEVAREARRRLGLPGFCPREESPSVD
jgi:hypothetical protein